MDKIDRAATAPAATRGHSGARSSHFLRTPWGMLLAMLAVGAVVLFVAPNLGGGSWSVGGTGLLLLLILLPCLLMPFMMGRGHSDRSDQSTGDRKDT